MLCMAFYSFAGAKDKLFEEAIKRGPDWCGVYHIDNSKMKQVLATEMWDYIEAKGYIPIAFETTLVKRYGDITRCLVNGEFTDNQHYTDYVCGALAGLPYKELTDKGAIGSFYLLPEKDKGYLAPEEKNLTRYNNALWNGKIVDGLIDGDGKGFIKCSDGEFITFYGSFDHGLPSGEIVMATAYSNVKQCVDRMDIRLKKFGSVGTIGCRHNFGTKDTLLNRAISHRLITLYSNALEQLDKAQKNIQPLSASNYSNFNVDKELRRSVFDFINVYEKINYDPQNKLAKAHELRDVYQTLDALKLEIRSSYYGYNLWSLFTSNYEWFDRAESFDNECLKTGLNKSKLLKKDSKYGFRDFFAGAYTILDAKFAKFLKKIEADSKEYHTRHSARAQANAELKEKLSHEIDEKESVEPTGRLEGIGFLTIDGYKYEKDGEILMSFLKEPAVRDAIQNKYIIYY